LIFLVRISGIFGTRRLQGMAAFKLRVGDYRIIHTFEVHSNVLQLITLGHRREVYRDL
jgi:mRNA-degrading endonuclease RelE of RelBE toxin-antitoxin system